MGFLRRLGWYLFGLSLGIIILVFILKKKSADNPISFCYLPNCRVLKDMRSKQIVFGENLNLKHQDTLLIEKLLLDGKIDFGKSNTNSTPCRKYNVYLETEEHSHYFLIANCDSTIVVNSAF